MLSHGETSIFGKCVSVEVINCRVSVSCYMGSLGGGSTPREAFRARMSAPLKRPNELSSYSGGTNEVN